MDQFKGDQKINLQYITQLIQSEDFFIQKYKGRSCLLNADDLPSNYLLELCREFQGHVQKHRKYQPGKGQSHEIILEKQASGGLIEPQEVEEIRQDQSQLCTLQISQNENISFPVNMQRYPMSNLAAGSLNLHEFHDQIDNSIFRRLAFLSVSGFIGFDLNERIMLMKGAFILGLESFFNFLMTLPLQPSPNELLVFPEDQPLDFISFVLQYKQYESESNNSSSYNNTIKMFIERLIQCNKGLIYSSNELFQISSYILKIEIKTMENFLLPLLHRIIIADIEKQPNGSNMKIQSNKTPFGYQQPLKQLVEYYQVHTGQQVNFAELNSDRNYLNATDAVELKYNNLLQQFDCPICFLPFRNAHIAICGHSFCQDCLYSAAQKFKSCPICMAAISEQDIYKNYHLSTINSIVIAEKEKTKDFEITRLKNLESFKSQFQQFFHTNILKSLNSSQQDIQNQQEQQLSQQCNQSFDEIHGLKKQIQYLVNITFDQLIDSLCPDSSS